MSCFAVVLASTNSEQFDPTTPYLFMQTVCVMWVICMPHLHNNYFNYCTWYTKSCRVTYIIEAAKANPKQRGSILIFRMADRIRTIFLCWVSPQKSNPSVTVTNVATVANNPSKLCHVILSHYSHSMMKIDPYQ